MSFTFSNNEATDYPALGMCDTCGKRFTQGCEHSNTLEAQQWLAAYAATEQSRDHVEYFLETQKDNEPAAVEAWQAERMNDPFRDERLDLKAEQLTGYFGKVKVTTSKEWDKRHLYSTREEQAGAAERRKAAGFLAGGDTDKI